MPYLNSLSLIGNVGKEPEVRLFENGNLLANFTFATTRCYKNRNEENVAETTWHNIVARGNLASFVQNCVHRGDLLFVEGELRSRSYKSKDDVERSIYEVNAKTIQILASKGGAEDAPMPEFKPEAQPKGSINNDPEYFREQPDDMPF